MNTSAGSSLPVKLEPGTDDWMGMKPAGAGTLDVLIADVVVVVVEVEVEVVTERW